MRRTAGGAALVAATMSMALTGCGSSGSSPSKAALLCQQMKAQLAALTAVSNAIHLQQQYATPQDAANAVTVVQSRMAAIAGRAGTEKVTDLVQPFSVLIITVQQYEANVLSQDVSAEPDVVSQLQTSTASVTDACARHTS